MLRRMLVAPATLAILVGLTGTAAAETKEIKLGTVAPKESAWGKVFHAWAKAVDEESGGAVKLSWFYGGSKGDEGAMVRKMRSGEIQGAAITATGLSMIWPHIGALQLPGLFPTWDKLDAARDKLSPKFDKEFEKEGFIVLGKGDVGMAHLMSRDFPVRVPDDLKVVHKADDGKSITPHPFFVEGDAIGKKVLEMVQVPPAQTHSLQVPLILPAVSGRGEGAINIINAPPIAAEQLGWAPHMNHIVTMPSGIGIGALVLRKEAYDGLPQDAKAVLERTGKNTGKLLTDRIRAIDAQAYERMKKNMKVIELNDAEKAQWAALFAKVRNALKAENAFRADIVDQVAAAAGQ